MLDDRCGTASEPKLEVRQGNKEMGNHVPGLTMVTVASVAQIDALLTKAATNRSTHATDMNEHSSRSHLLMMLEVEGRDGTARG